MLSNRILSIRISGKERKERIRAFLLDLAQFRNLLILLIRKYKELYGYYLTDQSILYGLLAGKEYSPKKNKEQRLKRFREAKGNILKDKELMDTYVSLRKQKNKIDNNYALQQVIRSVVKSFNDYRKAYREYKENPEKFKGIPRPPKPKKLKFLMNFSVELNVNTFKQLEDGILIRLRINKKQFLKVKLPKDFDYEVKSIKLKLLWTDTYADVVYKVEVPELNTEGRYIAGIDLGLNNLIALVSTNPGLKSLIISGKEIKAFNQWFNKEKSKLQSEIDILRNKLSGAEDKEAVKQLITEKQIKLKELSAYRKRKIDNDFHKISRRIVDILKATDHRKLYIGKGATESKNRISIGKRNNQHFVSVPFRRLIELIKYKAKEAGIEVEEVNEAYTSKTSPFADIFKVRKLGREYFKVKSSSNKSLLTELLDKLSKLRQAVRTKRGLVKDNVKNKVFNADLVGAYNILRVGTKSFKVIDEIKTLFVKLCNPVKCKLIEFLYQVSPESLWIGSSSSLSAGLNSFDYQSSSNLAAF